ncbi:MAG: rod shape-determining protein MreD [Dysgonamonadaceae bacterium]|jgi:rod shape-determining protein MreD|nr:rod shape-determining protein MreD [Dysgonamonadaceae bacterium]
MAFKGLRQTTLFFLLVLLQVCFFNRIHLLGYATPFIYIYLIIKFPIDMNRNVVMLVAALMGLILDMFSYTLGLNMLSCVMAGFLRFNMLKLFTPRDIIEFVTPSFTSFGKGLFLRYAGFVTMIHHSVLFSIESLSFFDPSNLLYRIISSFILTMFLIFAFESIDVKISKT